jgi:hypothetical protein
MASSQRQRTAAYCREGTHLAGCSALGRVLSRKDGVDALVQGLAAVALSSLASKPSQDCSERASVPSTLAWQRNTWTALMPILTPVQPGTVFQWTAERTSLTSILQVSTLPGSRLHRAWSVTT